jgi:hypothetical protein
MAAKRTTGVPLADEASWERLIGWLEHSALLRGRDVPVQALDGLEHTGHLHDTHDLALVAQALGGDTFAGRRSPATAAEPGC